MGTTFFRWRGERRLVNTKGRVLVTQRHRSHTITIDTYVRLALHANAHDVTVKDIVEAALARRMGF